MQTPFPEPTPESDALTEERNIQLLRRPRRSRIRLGVAAAVFFCAAGLSAVWLLAPPQPLPPPERLAAAPVTTRIAPPPAIQPAQGGPLVPVDAALAAPPQQPILEPPQPAAAPQAAPVAEVAPPPRSEPPQIVAALPPAAQPAPTPRPRISSEEALLLIERAERALREQRDVIAARQFLQRAEQGGHARAAFMLAETFDPAILNALGVRGVRPDPARARALYEQAQAGGVTEAAARLERLR
jgi:hypothetical protein